MIDPMLSQLNDYLNRITSLQYDEKDLVRCRDLLAYDILGHIRRRRYSIRYESSHDTAVTCANFFFGRIAGKFVLLEKIYSLRDEPESQKKVISRLIRQVLSDLFYQNDPTAGKIYRNIRIAISQSDEFMFRMDRGCKTIVRRKDLSLFHDYQFEISIELLQEELCNDHVSLRKPIETIKAVFKIIDRHNCRKSISLNTLIRAIRLIILARFGQECVEALDTVQWEDYLMIAAVSDAISKTMAMVKRKIETAYLQESKNEQICQSYAGVIEAVLAGMFLEHPQVSKSRLLRKYLNDMDYDEYFKIHRLKLDYLERFSKATLISELKRSGVFINYF